MPYQVTQTPIEGVLVLEPKVFGDARGFFFESFNQRDFNQATGLNETFVQDNHSKSAKGVLRGLHYQTQHPQGKLVRVTQGAVFDVAVDIRPGSKTFGQWFGTELSSQNKRQMWIPEGLAHGFLVTSAVSFSRASTPETLHRQRAWCASLCRTTTASPPRACCAGCTTRCSTRRASWCG